MSVQDDYDACTAYIKKLRDLVGVGEGKSLEERIKELVQSREAPKRIEPENWLKQSLEESSQRVSALPQWKRDLAAAQHGEKSAGTCLHDGTLLPFGVLVVCIACGFEWHPPLVSRPGAQPEDKSK